MTTPDIDDPKQAERVFRAAAIVWLCTLGLLLLSGCGAPEPPVTSGYVTDKHVIPAHWEGGWDEDCGYNYDFWDGEYKYSCDSEWDPHDIWVEEVWELQLRECRTDEKTEKTKCRQGWIEVSPRVYARYGFGSHFPDPL